MHQPILLSFPPPCELSCELAGALTVGKCTLMYKREVRKMILTSFHPVLSLRGGGLQRGSNILKESKKQSSKKSLDHNSLNWVGSNTGKTGAKAAQVSGGKSKRSRKKSRDDGIEVLDFEQEKLDRKKKKKSGIDWNTWQKKPKASEVDDTFMKPIVGSGGSLYGEVFRRGKLVKKKIRHGFGDASDSEIEERARLEADAIVRAAMMTLNDSQVHVGTLPLGEIAADKKGSVSQGQEWKKALFRPVRAALESEAKGMYFTGEYKKDGSPIYTNSSTHPHPITGEPVPLKKKSTRFTVAEQEAAFHYKSKAEMEAEYKQAKQLRLMDKERAHRGEKNQRENAGQEDNEDEAQPREVRSDKAATAGSEAESEAPAADGTENKLVESSSSGTRRKKKKTEGVRDISNLIRELKAKKVTLTKRQRYQKHVMGFSQEAVERMMNGTLATDSEWGPHKVIGGAKGGERGQVWGGLTEGLGRKRRDASWFRIAALKGNGKAQVQLALAYR
jgi:hypothetical protein